ncbi:response regulator receiver modulated diguanylate cyclase [Glaciecola sp. KUL10]|nr:response regulator receiver modulated diguanylate cyclase [Glaciecola sp. KUL10]
MISEYETTYIRELGKLLKTWELFEQSRKSEALLEFQKQCLKIYTDITPLTLFALQQIIKSLIDNSNDGLKEQKSIDETILDNKWLIDQLITGQKEKPDPFLVEVNSDVGGEDLISSFINQHENLLHRIDKQTVGIIDDQKSIGHALIEILHTFAINAYWFESIEKYEESDKDIDLILLDIVMPKVTQTEVFEFAKRQSEKGQKVIVCSSTFTFETRLAAVRAGCADFITKPINSYSLIEKISRTLGTNQSHAFQLVLVDDQATMGTFYKLMIEQEGCDVIYFESAEGLFKELENLRPDLFLLDMNMPDVDGIELAKMLRYEAKFDFTPIIFITADETVETRLHAISAGAEDVISKASAIGAVKSQILTRLKRANDIRKHVARDALTGVLNHGQIAEVTNQIIKRSRREKQPTSLAVIDLDKFKQVNDTFGHVVGDRVLFSLGQLLMNSLRDTDAIGRWGGEEFVIAFENCTVDAAAKKLNSIKSAFKAMSFSDDKGGSIHVSFSAGVIQLGQKTDLEEAIILADKGLYKAKHAGRDKIVTFICK